MAEGFVRLNLPDPYLPFAEGNFPTPSGKCEFFSARMAADGYPPVPAYTPPRWADELAQTAVAPDEPPPLACISPPAHSFLNSTFVNLARFQRREGQPLLQIHPQDAAARGIGDGDLVEVGNGLGTVQLTAAVTDAIVPGTVLAPGVWWARFASDGRTINQVVAQAEADMGASAVFYDAIVRVVRADTQHVEAMAAQPAALVAEPA